MIACMLRDASRAKKSINWHERTKHENVRCISLTWQKIAWELKTKKKKKKKPKYVLRRTNETSCRGSDRRYTLKLPILPILLGCCIFWESSAAASQSTALEQHQGSPWKTRRQFTHKICDPESFKWCKSAESTNGLGLAYMSSVTRPASSTSPSWTKQHNICERLSAAPECFKCCKPPISEPIKSKGRPNIPMVYLGRGRKVHRTWEAKLHIIHQRTYMSKISSPSKKGMLQE